MELKNKIINGTLKLTIINYGLFAMNFFIQLYLAKMLSPDTFGQISFLLAIISVLSAFGQWGVGSVIAIRNDKSFLDAVFTLKLLFSILLFIASLLYLGNIPNTNNSKLLFLFISLAMCFQNIAEVPRLVLQINIEFSKIGIIRVLNKIIAIGSSIILVIFGLDIWALGLLYGIEMFLDVIFVFISPYKPRFNFDINHTIWFFKYAKNILYVNFMGNIENKYDDFIVGKVAGSSALGIYNIGWKITRLFNTTTISTFSSVVVPSLAKVSNNHDKFNYSYNFLLRNIIRLLFLVYGMVFILAPYIIETFMGIEWISSVYIIRFGIIYSLLLPLYTINREVFYALGKPEMLKRIQVVLFIIIIISVPLAVILYKEIGAVLALSFAYLIGTILSFKTLSTEVDICYFNAFFPSLVAALVAMIVSWNFSKYILIKAVVYLAIYLIILFSTSFKLLKEDLNSVKDSFMS